MKDETLLDISILVSIIGIVALLIMSYLDKIPEYSIEDINSGLIGEKISLTAQIQGFREYNKTTILTLRNNCTIEAMMMDSSKNSNNKTKYTINSYVKIVGIVDNYNDKETILIEKIELTK